LHDARHSHATTLYAATKDLRLVQKQLGHSRPSITAIYADVADAHAREGVKAMEKLFRNAGKGHKVGVSAPQPCVSI
jgi:site-specific recombinase XerD